jgi:hypothetical protein
MNLWWQERERTIIHDCWFVRRPVVLRPSSDAGRRSARENGIVSDDWLRHGHEVDGADLAPVFSSASVLADGAGTPPPTTWTSGWRAVVVGGGVALLATLGVVSVANAISDNLFPSMGSTRPASVWQNPVPPAEPTPTTVVVPSTATTAPTTTPSTSPTTVPATTPTTVSTTEPTSAASSRAIGSPNSAVTTVVSPTTSVPDRHDGDDSVDDTADDGPVDDTADDGPIDDGPIDDDLLDDSDGSSGSGSGSDDSRSSGSSGSDDGSDDDG